MIFLGCNFFPIFLESHLWHMKVSRLGVESQLPAYTTATVTWYPSKVWDLHHSSWQQLQIINTLSEARDWTCVLMDTSWVRYCWAMTELLFFSFNNRHGKVCALWVKQGSRKRALSFSVLIICCPRGLHFLPELSPGWRGLSAGGPRNLQRALSVQLRSHAQHQNLLSMRLPT